MPQPVSLSAVIPTWNGKRLLETYLPSVFAAMEHFGRSSGGDWEVVIVDDGGADGTLEWLEAHHSERMKIIVHEENRGFPMACNTGFQAARHPIVLLLNNDVRLKSDCIPPLLEHFEDPSVFGVTGKLFNQKEDRFCNGGKIARFRRGMWSTYENYDQVPWVKPDPGLLSFTAIGAFSAFDRLKFLEIDGFDPLCPMVEDVEISYRAWKRGWCIKYEPRSVAYHDASRTMDVRYKRKHLDRISRRSRILMHWMLLHDADMFRSHVLSLSLRFLTGWIVLDWRYYWAIFTGLRQWKAVRRKRNEVRRTMVRSDREILETLQNFYRTAPIAPRQE